MVIHMKQPCTLTKEPRVIPEFLDALVLHPASPEEVHSGASLFYDWTPQVPYASAVYAAALEKKLGKAFVILNFADIQCHDGEAFSEVGEFAEETIARLIEKTKPDLITLTGDNAFDAFAHLRLIRFLDSFGIPWAPVMGNADHTGVVSEFWIAWQLVHAKHCLFRLGPEGMGYGNYIVNITENGKTVHTLFFMDTHHEEEMQTGSYDHLYDTQLSWYRWAVEGIAAEARHPVPSSVFFHIPVPEYKDAWDAAHDAKTGELLPIYRDVPFCKRQENYGFPRFNNGFFALCRTLGSTKNMICGHDHVNCFSLPYEGITLTYAMKTGYGCYWEHKTQGGTTLTVYEDGTSTITQYYIDPQTSENAVFLDWYHNHYLKETEEKNHI